MNYVLPSEIRFSFADDNMSSCQAVSSSNRNVRRMALLRKFFSIASASTNLPVVGLD